MLVDAGLSQVVLVERAGRVVVDTVLRERPQMSLAAQLLADARLVASGTETRARRLTHLMAHLTDGLTASSSGRLRQNLAGCETGRTLRIYRVELLLASSLVRALLSDLDALQEVLVQRLIVAGGT